VSDAEDRARKRVGSVLNDKWTLEELLGVGGMAAVYSARHRNGARAAIKILHPTLASVEEVRDRFLREGYAANRVEHKGAVQVLDDDVIVGEPEDGAPYLVMELLEGETLLTRTKRGLPLPEREALLVVDAVLDVLESAHARGVVHRDLKPENLFLPKDADPLVKIVDFGLARLIDRQGQTIHGMAIGTPSYMSPEQAAGKVDQIDARTDLFALGATAFELLTGRTVHGKGDVLEIVMKVAKEQAPAIRTITLSFSLGRIIQKPPFVSELASRSSVKPDYELSGCGSIESRGASCQSAHEGIKRETMAKRVTLFIARCNQLISTNGSNRESNEANAGYEPRVSHSRSLDFARDQIRTATCVPQGRVLI